MKTTTFLITLILLSTLTSAASIVEVNLSTSESYKSIDSSNVLIKLQTDTDSECKYSFSDKSFLSMQDFDITGNINHRQTISNLKEGTTQIYFTCADNSSTQTSTKLNLDVNALITAKIELSKNEPISSGNIQVKLKTSKAASSTPSLTYAINGENRKTIPLEGSSEEWEGSINIAESTGEEILSFSFQAEDLEGRTGTEITSGNFFEIDTIAPSKITDWKVDSDEDKINLSWHFDEDYDKIKIYRSTSPGVDYLSYYTSTSKSYYIDKDVDEGIIYYYKVSAIDEAENEGPFSDEKSATSLSSEDISSATTLSSEMISKINTFLSKASTLQTSLQSYKIKTSELTPDQKEALSTLNLEKISDNLLNELKSIHQTAQNYKDQTISEESLSTKLDSLEMKLKVIETEFPTSITISETYDDSTELDQETIRNALYKYDQSLSESTNDKNTKATLDLLKERNLQIKNHYSLIKVEYYDTSTEEFTIAKKTLSSTLSLADNGSFFEILPEDLSERIDEIQFTNKNLEKLSAKNMFSFDSSTKNIQYYIYGNFLNELKETQTVYFLLSPEAETNSKITGFAILTSSGKNGIATTFSVVILALIGYLFFLKNKNLQKEYSSINSEIKNFEKSIKDKDILSAKTNYKSLKENYSGLSEKKKQKVYPKIKNAKQKILITEFEHELNKIKKSKDKNALEKIEEKYERLPTEIKQKIEPIFSKIKKEATE